ncbi:MULTISPECIES: type VI secretion system baseplate subunit TssE [Symbiopectobacterium]|uniref:type VI secretion system baseplate subunit TssE n=1 Tax=Symbiopectobacterium TaxID=801 RepID=UPI001A206E82|nr:MULTISPECIES: type VI secretion system baseplate subunit TssE [Symbiopectobacterium]MBG6248329.1 type VI secretion system baseplate subunit TssE [Candidatus Symbiopectobacterium sp. PLON1]MBT9430237.1 type VI secretion system baseplate subunit TssE [Candidatus Symbiopectobacterium endolongispinus]
MPSLSAWERGSTASLFDRIRGETRRASPETELETLILSIKRQLDNVLNTRPGNCRSAPELGVIDFNDATQGGADIYGKICEAIRQCICHFEPRIVHVDVMDSGSLSNPLEMSFLVTAHVKLDDLEQVTSFNIQMDNHRHYRMV